MKYLVFCINNNITKAKLINMISKNYKLQKSKLISSDFIKSNNSYIYTNLSIINKILKLKIEFNDIDQVLYFETKPEYISYFSIIKLNNDFKTEYDTMSNYFFPKYYINNNKTEDNYYLIKFKMIDYIQSIQSNNKLNIKINTLKDKNNIVSKFDILHFKPVYVNLNVIGIDTNNSDIFNNFINNIKRLTHTTYDDFYRIDGEEYENDSRVLIILDEEINIFLNSVEGKNLINDLKQEIINYFKQRDGEYFNVNVKKYFCHSILKIHNKYIDDIDINFGDEGDIVYAYDWNDNIITSYGINWEDANEMLERSSFLNENIFIVNCYSIKNPSDKIQFIED